LDAVGDRFECLSCVEDFAPADRHGGIEGGPRPLGFVKDLEDFLRELAAILRADQRVGVQR
jgi:hypothetical protein